VVGVGELRVEPSYLEFFYFFFISMRFVTLLALASLVLIEVVFFSRYYTNSIERQRL